MKKQINLGNLQNVGTGGYYWVKEFTDSQWVIAYYMDGSILSIHGKWLFPGHGTEERVIVPEIVNWNRLEYVDMSTETKQQQIINLLVNMGVNESISRIEAVIRIYGDYKKPSRNSFDVYLSNAKRILNDNPLGRNYIFKSINKSITRLQ